ncbi:MAG TPA: hypothetical protein VII44_06380, partial [Puia sp.]
MLGWTVTIVDGRFCYALPQRFPKAESVFYGKHADILSKINGPAGLDIGAENATKIALSIIAEVKAFLSRRSGTS